MTKIKNILTDCLLIVPYTAIWLVAFMAAVIVVALRWIVEKLGG